MTFSHWLVDEKRGLCIKLKVNDDIWYAKPIYLYLYQKDIAILMMVGFSIFVGGLVYRCGGCLAILEFFVSILRYKPWGSTPHLFPVWNYIVKTCYRML